MNQQQFYEDVQQFASLNSLDEIKAVCEQFCAQLGFDYFIYALRVPAHFAEAKMVLVNGYPARWVEHYFTSEYYKHDPVIAYCTKNVSPIRWDDLKTQPLSVASLNMLEDAANYGLKSGVSMPIHSPRGELGILSLAVNQSGEHAQTLINQTLPYIQLLANHVHQAVSRVAAQGQTQVDLQLSEREQECLRWAADGKTTWEIATLLGIAERTVNFHFNNAMLKLNVTSRQHAIAKATFKGLIQPKPF